MARNYLILLFSFAFFVGGGFMYWQVLNERESREITRQHADDLLLAIATEREHTGLLINVGESNISDFPGRYRFNMVAQLLDVLRKDLSDQECLGSGKDKPHLKLCLDNKLQARKNEIIDTIRHYHQFLDLTEENLQPVQQNLEDAYTLFVEEFAEASAVQSEINSLRAELYYVISIRKLAKNLVWLTGEKSTPVTHYWPVIQLNKSLYRKGESSKCVLSIGSYTTAFEPEDVRIIVNGDTLPVGLDRRARYTPPTDQRGEITLNAQCIINNPVTGKVITGRSTFAYEVR